MLPRDEAAEARVFEPVVAALEAIAPGVEITRPGLAAIGVRGPTRYFGGETGVLHALSRGVAGIPVLNGADLLIGIADGAFAAEQAARRGLIVDPGGSPAFLENLPIETLDPSGASPLIDLLRRLGVRTLGAFAALPPRDVLARFGPDGAWAHRQAGGRDERPVSGRRPPVEFSVTLDLEPPVDRVDTVTFSARGIAEQFVADLGAHGLACTCLELQALSENGEETVRRWRHAGVLSTVDVLDRIRWQLEGWLSGRAPADRRRHAGAAGPDRGGAHRRAPAGAVGRVGRARRAGRPRAGPGADAARARLGADPGARRRPRPRAAHPAGAVGRRADAAALARAAVAGAAAGPGAVGAARPAAAGPAARRRPPAGGGHRARGDAGAARAVRRWAATASPPCSRGPGRGRWTSGGGAPTRPGASSAARSSTCAGGPTSSPGR